MGVAAHLCPAPRRTTQVRAIPVRKDDEVTVVRGTYKVGARRKLVKKRRRRMCIFVCACLPSRLAFLRSSNLLNIIRCYVPCQHTTARFIACRAVRAR